MCGGHGPVRYDNLVDRLFGSAGVWRLRECGNCSSLWLDPRPVGETLAQAYAHYYTHADGSGRGRAGDGAEGSSKGALRALFERGMFALARRRWGYPSTGWLDVVLALVLGCLPRCVEDADLIAGHLPASRRGKVLDVGCGSGGLVAGLEELGWQASGIDPDPVAVGAGRAQGLDLSVGGIQDAVCPDGTYDAVIAVHVIEHVEDPSEFIRNLRDMIGRDGTVVVVTPNAGSQQLQLFGEDWRSLEPPRHLVLMGREALESVFLAQGFVIEHSATVCRAANVNWRATHDYRHSGQHDMTRPATLLTRVLAECALLRCSWHLRRHPDAGEEIVLVARPAAVSAT